VKAFLDAPPPAGGWAPVFSHNDLGIEHAWSTRRLDGDRRHQLERCRDRGSGH
jgi:hypothetical protein